MKKNKSNTELHLPLYTQITFYCLIQPCLIFAWVSKMSIKHVRKTNDFFKINFLSAPFVIRQYENSMQFLTY